MTIKSQKKGYSLASNVLLLSWMVAFTSVIAVVTIEEYIPKHTLESLPYLIVNAILMYLGILVGTKGISGKNKNKYSVKHYKYLTIKRSVFYLFILFFLVSLIAIGRTSYSSIADQRELHVKNITDLERGISSGGSIITYLIQYSQAFSVIFACIIPAASNLKLQEKVISFLTIATLNYMILRAYGGFQNFLVPVILPFLLGIITIAGQNPVKIISVPFKKISPSKKKSLALVIITILLVAVASIYFLINRGVGYSQYSSDAVLKFLAMTRLRPYVKALEGLGIQGEVNHSISFVISKILNYLSNGIINFGYFFQNYEYPPALGGFQFNFITSRLGQSEEFSFGSLRYEIFSIYRRFGIDGYVWGTYIRDYVVDFGKELTLMLSFLSGIMIGFLESIRYKKYSLYTLYIILLTWLSFSPFFSLLTFQTFQIAFLLGITWVSIDLLISNKKITSQSRRWTNL